MVTERKILASSNVPDADEALRLEQMGRKAHRASDLLRVRASEYVGAVQRARHSGESDPLKLNGLWERAALAYAELVACVSGVYLGLDEEAGEMQWLSDNRPDGPGGQAVEDAKTLELFLGFENDDPNAPRRDDDPVTDALSGGL